VILRASFLALVVALGLSGPAALATTALTDAQARTAAERLLDALRRGDSQAVFDQLAPELQTATTVAKVRERLRREGTIRATRIRKVLSGADDSTVEAQLTTGKGVKDLVLVLDDRGTVLGWELDQQDTPIRQIAARFITSLSEGKVVDARSLLSLDLQQQFPPQQLLNRWMDLQKVTGGFQRIRGTVVASQGGPQQLVLVTTEFSRLTDNLFVIIDPQGHIIGIDFPRDARTAAPGGGGGGN
jgi:hypothetical protein